MATADDAELGAVLLTLFHPGSIDLQKYLADQGGYPYWHCELYPHPRFDAGESLHRVVLWTIYLYDGIAGGETEFLHQDRKIVPKAGSLLVAPTAFTHASREHAAGCRQAHRHALDTVQAGGESLQCPRAGAPP